MPYADVGAGGVFWRAGAVNQYVASGAHPVAITGPREARIRAHAQVHVPLERYVDGIVMLGHPRPVNKNVNRVDDEARLT